MGDYMENTTLDIMKYLYGMELETLPGKLTLADGKEIYAPTGRVKYYDYISSKFGEDFAIDLVKKYGRLLQRLKIDWTEEATKEEVVESLEHQIYLALKGFGDRRNISFPKEFKEKYNDIFLSDDAPHELKEAYYAGWLTFKMIKDNPEFAGFLKGKVLYGRILNKVSNDTTNKLEQRDSYSSGIFLAARASAQQTVPSNVEDEQRWLYDEELLQLALTYGDYLFCVGTPIYNTGDYKAPIPHHDDWSLEQKIQHIESEIEKEILGRRAQYGEDAPGFFKQKHPELFLALDAPDDLKEWFYRNVSYDHRNNMLNADIKDAIIRISEHPEWRSFLVGKDIGFAVNEYRYEKFFQTFDNEIALKLIYKYPETIKKMMSIHGVSSEKATRIMKTWYEASRMQISSE